MKSYKKQVINVLGTSFFIIAIFYAIVSYLSTEFLLKSNSKTSTGMIYKFGVARTNRVCRSYFIFYANNRLVSGYVDNGDKSCNDFRIGQKGVVTYNYDDPSLYRIDFSISPDAKNLDSIYNNHILFKSNQDINNLFND